MDWVSSASSRGSASSILCVLAACIPALWVAASLKLVYLLFLWLAAQDDRFPGMQLAFGIWLFFTMKRCMVVDRAVEIMRDAGQIDNDQGGINKVDEVSLQMQS
jgi:hypothetical protein